MMRSRIILLVEDNAADLELTVRAFLNGSVSILVIAT